MHTIPRFPNQADVIFEQAQAFRRLSGSDRLLAIFDLMASGTALLRQSPQREVGLRLRTAQEEEWKQVQRELFERHAQ